jgi:voltage-gated potassium channel
VTVGGLSFYLSERVINEDIRTLPDAMWWSIVTITTVGYGDLTPETGVGKVVAAVLMVSGMVTLALFAGIVGSSLMNTVLSMREETFRMSNTIDHVVICGYQPGARMLLDTLNEELDLDHHTVVVFAPYERPPDVPPEFRWIQGDPTKESELEKVRIAQASAVILVGARGELPQQADANTILTAFTLRRYMRGHATGPPRKAPLYVVAEILDAENVEHARTAGADEVIETTRMGFSLLAHAVEVHGTATILGELADVTGNSLFVGRVPDDIEEPMSFGSVSRQLKQRHGMLVLGLRKPDADRDLLNPEDDMAIERGDGVIYLARKPALPRM